MGKLRTRLTVALVSATAIALELVWMRALALRFWHHFSYLIIATALLGFGASGTVLSLARGWVAPRRRGALAAAAMLFAVSIGLTIRAAEWVPLNVQFLTWDRGQVGLLILIELIFMVPLLLAGSVVGLALMDDPRRIAGHYAVNLIGSGAGAVGAVAMLELLSTSQAMAALTAVACVGGLASVPLRKAAGAIGASAAVAALILLSVLAPWRPSMSQYKMLSQVRLMPGTETICSAEGPLGRIDVVAGPGIHHAPGLSLNCDEPIPPHVLMITDGDQTSPVYQVSSAEEYAFLDWTTPALPYHLLEAPRVLIVGAGGGADIGLAVHHGCRRIVGVEMNPQVIDLMDGPLTGRGGEVYRWGGVEIVNQEARGYLAGSDERFELIQLPLIDALGASGAGVYAGHESYLYTVEALEMMLARLSPDGMICVTRWIRTPPRDGLRVFATAAEALRRRGCSPASRLAMIRSWATVTVLISPVPLEEERAEAIRAFCEQRGFDLCWLPGLTAEQANRFHRLDRPYCYEGARALLGPQREAYLSDYIFDVRPRTDDRPYFHHFLRLRALPEISRQLGRLGRAHLELGYVLLLAALAQCVPVGAALIVLPLVGRVGLLRRAEGKGRALAYFLFIGVGFMFLEMNFLQRLTLYLAHPIYSAGVVIGSFLVFGGLGSQLSARWRSEAGGVVRRAGLLVVALTAGYALLLDRALALTQPWPAWARAVLAVAAVAPLAVAMGHMFPVAMRRLGLARPVLVPWCWAINGFASVVATVAATVLAMEVGFRAVLLLGAGAYLAAAVVGPVARPESPGHAATGAGAGKSPATSGRSARADQ